MDLGQILAQIAEANSRISQGSQQVASGGRQLNEINAANIEATRKAEEAKSSIQSQKEQLTMDTEARILEIVNRLGGNVDAQGALIAESASRFQEGTRELIASQDKISQLENQSFLDNPIGYIMGRFALRDETIKYNQAIDKVEVAKDTVANISTLSNNAAVSQKAVAKTTTLSMMQARAEEDAAKAEIAVNAVRRQGIADNINNINQVLQLDSAALDNSIKAKGLINQERRMQLDEAEFAQRKVEFNARMEQYTKAKQIDQDFVDTVNKGAEFFGKKPLSAVEIENFKKLANGQERLMDWYLTGKGLDNGRVVLGANPLEAASVLDRNRAATSPADDKIRSFMYTVKEGTEKANKTSGLDPKKLVPVVNNNIVNEAKKQLSNIDTTSSNSIYAPPSLSTLGNSSAVKSSALWKEVLSPLVSIKSDYPLKSEDIIPAAFEAYKNGKITYADLDKGLGTLYKAAAEMNNSIFKYEAYRLPEMNSFNTSVPTKPAVSVAVYDPIRGEMSDALASKPYVGTSVVNMMDDKARALYINKYLANMKPRSK